MNSYKIFALLGDMTIYQPCGWRATKREALLEAKYLLKLGHRAVRLEKHGVIVWDSLTA